ncbi:MAG TPA: Ig-like domain-containing protein, partial [Thermomicrobiales bacterium]|nr:Ig-like domain-containing protein [Thermomicrobiales bacterium]
MASDGPNDTINTSINATKTFEALANDGGGVHFGQVNQPGRGRTWSVGNGSITYEPGANVTGADVFTYTAYDANGALYTATVSVAITGTPTAVEARDDSVTTSEDTPLWLAPAANDANSAGGPWVNVTLMDLPQHGSAMLGTDGSVTYTPALDWSGTDTFTYSSSDATTSDSATVSITVNPVADVPRPLDDAVLINQGEMAEIDILANDLDPDGGQFDAVAVGQAQVGTATWDPGARMLNYSAPADFAGMDQFTYTVENRTGQATATVLVTVNGAPAANPDLVQVTAGSRTAIDVLSNDTDPESGTLHVIKVGKATAGKVSLAEDSGTVSYRPATGQTGEATFSYTIADDAGNTSDGVVTVTIVAAGNGAPVATNDEFLVGINSPG